MGERHQVIGALNRVHRAAGMGRGPIDVLERLVGISERAVDVPDDVKDVAELLVELPAALPMVALARLDGLEQELQCFIVTAQALVQVTEVGELDHHAFGVTQFAVDGQGLLLERDRLLVTLLVPAEEAGAAQRVALRCPVTQLARYAEGAAKLALREVELVGERV